MQCLNLVGVQNLAKNPNLLFRDTRSANRHYHDMIDSELYLSDSSVNGTDDREARPKFWIAAYTRPRSEKKAASELSKIMTTYVATQTQIKQWSYGHENEASNGVNVGRRCNGLISSAMRG